VLDHNKVGVPVYTHSSGTLVTHWFVAEELNISANELDAWIAAHRQETIKAKYGDEALLIEPPVDEGQSLRCPRCHDLKAEVKVDGIY
jgi:hypothetical protein